MLPNKPRRIVTTNYPHYEGGQTITVDDPAFGVVDLVEDVAPWTRYVSKRLPDGSGWIYTAWSRAHGANDPVGILLFAPWGEQWLSLCWGGLVAGGGGQQWKGRPRMGRMAFSTVLLNSEPISAD